MIYIEESKKDIVIGNFTAPYNKLKRCWMFPAGVKINEISKAMRLSKMYAAIMEK